VARHVRDSAFWGMPVGTPIVAGMRPARAKMAKGAAKAATGSAGKPAATPAPRTSAAAMFSMAAGKGRMHSATSKPQAQHLSPTGGYQAKGPISRENSARTMFGSAGKPQTAVKAAPDVSHHAAHLDALRARLNSGERFDARRAADEYLAKVKGDHLKALEKHYSNAPGRTAAKKRENLREIAVGRLADSQAIDRAAAARPASPAQVAKPAGGAAHKFATTAERVTSSGGKLQPHVSGDALKKLDADVRAAKKQLTPGELKAVEQWTAVGGMVRKIQSGNASAETMRNFDESMKELPKVNGLVYRSISSESGSSAIAANLKPGQVLELGSPVSTSIDPRKSAAFGTNVYEIESPAASYVAGVGSKYTYEKEAVLAPGRFEVVSVEMGTVGLGKHNAPVRIVRLRDVTTGDRSWQPTTGKDFSLAGATPTPATKTAQQMMSGAR
jgi:hypothetical protein